MLATMIGPGALAGQSGATAVHVAAGVGMTIVHLPAFTYTRGLNRIAVNERAQEGGGLAFSASVEAMRSRRYLGARYQFVVDPSTDNWFAHVGAAYAGLARRGPTSSLQAAVGFTIVSREQVTRQFAPSLCLYSGCASDFTVNRDGGTITTAGALFTAAATRRVRGAVSVGVEGFAATGPQRYVGGMVRISLGPSS